MAGTCSTHRKMRNTCKILDRKPEGKRPLGIPGVVRKIMLGWIVWRWGDKVCSGYIWLGIGTSGGLLSTQ
jgi:hypothetical protein